MANPLISQGTLNKIRSQIVVSNTPGLNITPPYMGRNFVTVSLDEDFAKLIPTATGGVASPEPYVMATVVVGILRTQSLATSWRTQWESQTSIGPVSIFPDTTAFGEIDLDSCIIQHFDPNAWDGEDPVCRLTLRGIYYVNSAMWSI